VPRARAPPPPPRLSPLSASSALLIQTHTPQTHLACGQQVLGPRQVAQRNTQRLRIQELKGGEHLAQPPPRLHQQPLRRVERRHRQVREVDWA
jgi:hypothetical protein